jgi:hypothetical protein
MSESSSETAMLKLRSQIPDRMMALLKARHPASICPSEVARALTDNPSDWRALMPEVRNCARELARAGFVLVTQRGTVLDAEQPYRGAIRLRLALK